MKMEKTEMAENNEAGCLCEKCKKKGCEMMPKEHDKDMPDKNFNSAMNKTDEKMTKRFKALKEE